MKTYGILGILWLIVGCCGAYVAIHGIITLMMVSVHDPKWHGYLHWSSSMLLLNSVIIVTSMFLVRGAEWARWLLGSFAIVFIITALGHDGFSFPIKRIISSIFLLVSAVLLLKPRQHDTA
jgi:hypothetical protein